MNDLYFVLCLLGYLVSEILDLLYGICHSSRFKITLPFFV